MFAKASFFLNKIWSCYALLTLNCVNTLWLLNHVPSRASDCVLLLGNLLKPRPSAALCDLCACLVFNLQTFEVEPVPSLSSHEFPHPGSSAHGPLTTVPPPRSIINWSNTHQHATAMVTICGLSPNSCQGKLQSWTFWQICNRSQAVATVSRLTQAYHWRKQCDPQPAAECWSVCGFPHQSCGKPNDEPSPTTHLFWASDEVYHGIPLLEMSCTHHQVVGWWDDLLLMGFPHQNHRPTFLRASIRDG